MTGQPGSSQCLPLCLWLAAGLYSPDRSTSIPLLVLAERPLSCSCYQKQELKYTNLRENYRHHGSNMCDVHEIPIQAHVIFKTGRNVAGSLECSICLSGCHIHIRSSIWQNGLWCIRDWQQYCPHLSLARSGKMYGWEMTTIRPLQWVGNRVHVLSKQHHAVEVSRVPYETNQG